MKHLIPSTILTALIAAFSLTAGDAGTGPSPAGARKRLDYNLLPVQFESNVGQAKKNVDFIGRGLYHSLELEAGGALIGGTGKDANPVRLRLLGSDPSAKPEGVKRLATDIGYFMGSDPSKWLRHVPAFERVRYGQAWPGVDVVYYGTQGRLEYDFVVSAGVDPGQIRVGFSGVKSLKLDASGDLLVDTGSDVLRQRKPRVYQKTETGVQEIAGSYVVENGTVGFELGQYDTSKDLVIDPVLIYAKILDVRFTSGNAVTLDASGNAYFAGQAFFQVSANPVISQSEAYIVEVDPIGNQIFSRTFGGTSGPTGANAVALDGLGNVYVAGFTSADDIPLVGALQPILADGAPNGATDAFLFKLNSSLALAYSTYIGGHGNDVANGVAADSSGNAYLAGRTAAADFPKTVGLAFLTHTTTGFAIKINTTVAGAASKVWATLLGGSGTDAANAINVDNSGNATVAGTTTSADFMPTSGVGYNTGKANGANVDGFIARLNFTGANAIYFTYWPFGPISAMAGSGNIVYVTGQTNGNILTTSSNAFQVSGGANHAFMTKVDTSVGGVNSIPYSSYLGGSGADTGLGIAFDSLGRGYVVGTTTSANFPTTAGGIATPSPNALPDAFYTVLSTTSAPGLPGLVFSTYLGGNLADAANAVAVDANGNAVITGNSFSGNFISLLPNGVFAVKLGGSGSNQVPTPSSVTPVTSSGSSQTYTFQFSDLDGYQDLGVVNVLINSALDGRSACYLAYSRPANTLYLVDDPGTGLAPGITLNGSSGTASNSQCTVSGLGSSATGSGATLTLTVNLSFSAAFGGNKVIFMAARDSVSNNSGWVTMGVRGVPPLPTAFPLSVGVSPSYGTTSAATLTFTYRDQSDANNLLTVWAVINSTLDGGHACYVAYYRPANLLFLIPDDGNGSQSTNMPLNGSGSLSNSQCTVLGAGSSASVSGSQLSVTLNYQFKPAFSGHKAIWMAASTLSGQTTYWQPLGAYLAP